MRFTEIANPEDQLALWKLISDKVWAAFAKSVPQDTITRVAQPQNVQGNVAGSTKQLTMPSSRAAHKSTPAPKPKVVKAKRAPMAPAPKPLPKPTPQQLTPTQITKQQNQHHQQLAQHLHKELTKQQPHQGVVSQPPTPKLKTVSQIEPMNNSLDDREKDELIMHSRSEHPFKTVSQIKSKLTGRNRGF
jgi:hypothetical protein